MWLYIWQRASLYLGTRQTASCHIQLA
jgi:hypothetical protein